MWFRGVRISRGAWRCIGRIYGSKQRPIVLRDLAERGYIEVHGDAWQPTDQGYSWDQAIEALSVARKLEAPPSGDTPRIYGQHVTYTIIDDIVDDAGIDFVEAP